MIGRGDAAARANAFDVLRLVAAVLVLVSHSWLLLRHEDPFARWSGETLGGVGVTIFFAISGYLIAGSWERDPHPREYVAKRALRLLPALVVAAFGTAFVLGPLGSGLSPSEYLSQSGPYVYALKSSLLVEYDLFLPGAFAGNPYPFEVNGSLWSLPLEVACYALLAALGVLGFLRHWWLTLALAIVFALATTPVLDVAALYRDARGAAGTFLDVTVLTRLVATFFLGATLWTLRDRVPWRWPIAVALLGAWALAWHSEASFALAVPAIGYTVLYLARRRPGPLAVLVRPGDASYGIYIWAFPIQQLVIAHAGPLTPVELLAISLPVTYAVGLLSWRLVEAPALALKRRIRPRQVGDPRVAPASAQ